MIVSYTYTTELLSGDLGLELTISGMVKNTYRIVESLLGEKFGESSVIRQTKSIQISTYN